MTRAVLAKLAPEQPVCVSEPSGQAFTAKSYAGKVDLAVYHPRKPDVNGRPEWLATDPSRRVAPIRFTPSEEISLIQAVIAIETMGAVPSDHVLVPPGQSQTTLYLRPGYYVIRRETLQGWEIIGSLSIDE